MAIESVFIPEIGAFFLVFAIVLGILTSVKILGNNKIANAIIAAVFGFFSAMYEPFVIGVQEWLPIASIILILLFFIVLVKKLFGGGGNKEKEALPLVVAIISLLVVLISQWNLIKNYLPAGWSVENVGWGLSIVLVLLIFWIVYSRKAP